MSSYDRLLVDTRSFTAYMNTEEFYVDLAKDIETWFDSSNKELERPLPKGKNKKVIGLIKY